MKIDNITELENVSCRQNILGSRFAFEGIIDNPTPKEVYESIDKCMDVRIIPNDEMIRRHKIKMLIHSQIGGKFNGSFH